MLGCQRRHEFSDSNAWIASTDVPPKEFHWPLCTGWRLGWYRMLPMPVSMQSCECCPVVNWYSMLCHTHCNRSLAWSVQWPGTASKRVSVPPHFKWATTQIRFIASLHCVFSTLICFLKERRESHHSPRNFVDSSTGRNVFPILIAGGLWTLDRGGVKCMTLHFWAANLKPFLVAHSCIALTACCKCLWCRGSAHENRLRGHPRTVLWRCPSQYMRAAHWSSDRSMSQQGHHQLEHLPLGRIHQRVWSQFWLWFCGPLDILTQKQAVCLWGQSCEGLEWCLIARLFHRPFPSQRRGQLPAASVQRYPGDIFQDSPGGQSCYDVFWSHTGICLVSCIFQGTRWSGC